MFPPIIAHFVRYHPLVWLGATWIGNDYSSSIVVPLFKNAHAGTPS